MNTKTLTFVLFVILLLILVSGSAISLEETTHANHLQPLTTPPANLNQTLPPNQPERGLIYDGLELPNDGSCPGLYRVKGIGLCTHGPDPAPVGVDVTKDAVAPLATALEPTASLVQCDGDGVSGKRIQVIYAHASDRPNRFNDYLTSLQQWVAETDAIFQNSAAETGGSRSIRFVHDGNCSPIILNITLSPTSDDGFGYTVNELWNLGFNDSNRKYMIFMDANLYCGIAGIAGDDQPGSNNASNSGPSYGRTDAGCWGGYAATTAAHELMHNLGGVQRSAPNSTYWQNPNHGNTWHCSDEWDVMCYDDDWDGPVQMSYVCPDQGHDGLFDCNHDDYYSTNPPQNSYLDTHWNTANNEFLITDVAPCNPGPNQIALFVNSGYRGQCTLKDVGQYPNPSTIELPNDSISSIKVGNNIKAQLCEHDNFEGTCEWFDSGDDNLGNNPIGDNSVSSVKVESEECQQNSNPNADQIMLFVDAGYNGLCVVKGIGQYPNPSAINLPNDSVSSIKVGSNTVMVLCENADYLGRCEWFYNNDDNLANNHIGDNSVSSVKVYHVDVGCNPGADQIALYVDPNYGWHCIILEIGQYVNPAAIGLPNDSISSIKVGSNVQARLCEGDNYTGICDGWFLNDDNNLANNVIGDNRVSSVEVTWRPDCTPDVNQYQGEYFANPDLNGEPTFVRCDDSINFDWSDGSPGDGIPDDNFSVRWTGMFNFEPGTYRFRVFRDDGARLWIDNVPKLDEWNDAVQEHFVDHVFTTGGPHLIQFEMYEHLYGAIAHLSWEILCNPGQDGLVLYERPNYSGNCITLTAAESDLNNSAFNDRASSIKLIGGYTAGWQVTLFEHSGYGGAFSTFRYNDIDLANNWIGRHRASSIRIWQDGDDGRWLTNGHVLQGTIHNQTDPDIYFFNGTPGQMVTLRMNRPAGSPLDSYLILYAPNGNILAEDNNRAGNLNAQISNFVLPASGRYRVVAKSAYSSSTGPYTITRRLLPAASCTPVQHGVILYDEPNYSGACVSFTADDPDFLDNHFDDRVSSIRFVGNYAGGHWQVTLSRHTVYGGSFWNFRHSDPNLGDNGLVQDQASSIRIWQDNDDGQTIGFGQTRTGTIHTPTDTDGYSFTGSQGQVVSISMTRQNNSLDSFLMLYGPSWNFLTRDDDSGGNNNALIANFILPANGTYRIIAQSYQGQSTGPYVLGLTLE